MPRLLFCLLVVLLAACNRQPQPSLDIVEDLSESETFMVVPDSGDLSAAATTVSGRLLVSLTTVNATPGTPTATTPLAGRATVRWFGPSGSSLSGSVNLKLYSRANPGQVVTSSHSVMANTSNFLTPTLPRPSAPLCLEATLSLTSSTGQRFNNSGTPITFCHLRRGETPTSALALEYGEPTVGVKQFTFGRAQPLYFNLVNRGANLTGAPVKVNIVLPEGLSFVGTDAGTFNCVTNAQVVECTTLSSTLSAGVHGLPLTFVATPRCQGAVCEQLAYEGRRSYEGVIEAFISGVANSTLNTSIRADAALTVAASDLSGVVSEPMNFNITVTNRGVIARNNVTVTLSNGALELVSGGSGLFNCTQPVSLGVITCQANSALQPGTYTLPLVLKTTEAITIGQSNGFDKLRLTVSATAGAQWNAATVNLTTKVCVTFPDANLEAAVREALAMPTGRICADDMQNLFALDGFFQGITDLTGLEYATNLASLDLGDNLITDISPLAGLSNLADLDLSLNTGITDISPLAGLSNLLSLNLYSTNPGDLSVLSGLTSLQDLNISFTGISDISALASLVNLTELDLSDNDLNNYTALANLTNLTDLDLSFTFVDDLSPLSGLPLLGTLNLSDNVLSDVSPLGTLVSLEELNLTQNFISDISALSALINVRLLDLSYNQIADLTALTPLETLETLNLETNLFSDIAPLVANPGLGQDDFVSLINNPNLIVEDGSQAQLDIQELENRGVTVIF